MAAGTSSRLATSTRTDHSPVAAAIEVYLRAGTTDPGLKAWTGDLREKAERSHGDLRSALIGEVLRRAAGRTHRPLSEFDTRRLTRRKVLPMVIGLFAAAEREAVLRLVERSIIFVTGANIERLLMDQRWDHTAWMLGNLHLDTLGMELLSSEALPLVGLSEETTCYVSPLYFSEDDPASDFLVHEVAHIFHNCKRSRAGLTETRQREWLLEIALHKRETFAYSCEFYSWVLEHSSDAGTRRRLAAKVFATKSLTDHRVDQQEVADIVLEAAHGRSGWKVILQRCRSLASSSSSAGSGRPTVQSDLEPAAIGFDPL